MAQYAYRLLKAFASPAINECLKTAACASILQGSAIAVKNSLKALSGMVLVADCCSREMCHRVIFSGALESADPILSNVHWLSNCHRRTIFIPWKHLLLCPSGCLSRKFVLFPSHCSNDVFCLRIIETAVVLYVLCLKGNS